MVSERRRLILILAAALALAGTAQAQLTWAGDIAVTMKGLDQHLTDNTNIRGDDPFSNLRLRLFPRRWISSRVALIGELLYDSGIRGGGIRVNGAYLVVNGLMDKPWLNLKAGLIPSPFGNYGLRSTYFNLNPLIGVPLLWHHRSPLESDVYARAETVLTMRRSERGYMPVGYDACWEIGWELFGELGQLEYSLALTEGTLSNPTESSNFGRQVIIKAGLNPMSGLRFGGSVARGPYLSATAADGDHPRVEDYDATVAGVYAEYKSGFLQLHSEAVQATYESPYITGNEQLSIWSGYLEGRYDILPVLHLAARYDRFLYSELTVDATTGDTEPWGNPVDRIEAGLGYRISREMMLKFVYQYNDRPQAAALGGPGITHVAALQLHMVF